MNKTLGDCRIEDLNKCIFKFDEATKTTRIFRPEWIETLPIEQEVFFLKLQIENTAGFINGAGLEVKLDHVCCQGNFDSVEKLLAFAEKQAALIKKLYPNYF